MRRIAIACFSTLLLIAAPAAAATLSVQVRETKLRAAPKSWAAAKGDLKYGDQVTLLAEEGDWCKVRSMKGAEGFVPGAAVTSSRVVLSGSAPASAYAGRTDVVLAGKGFGREIEERYKQTGERANYATVDSMERITISDAEIAAFIKQGNLNQGGL